MNLEPHLKLRCQEKAGFLFRHRCDQEAIFRCDVSGIALCRGHAYAVEWSALEAHALVGPAPTRPAPQAVISAATAQRLVALEGTTSSVPGGRWSASPHCYARRCNPGYGVQVAFGPVHGDNHVLEPEGADPHDFTEGDAAALGDPGDGGFEQDMGGS